MMNWKKVMKHMLVAILSVTLLFPVSGLAQEEATVKTAAGDLRSTLDHLLSEHFVLAFSAMTKAYDGAEDAEEAIKALDQNAVDMTPAIASVYGEEGAKQFEAIFREHNNYTDDIVKAAKENDEELRMEAEKEVASFVKEFASFLASATEGKLPEEAANEAISLHEKQVLTAFDAYVKEDYQASYQAFREGYAHMFVISDALSAAITKQFPEKFNQSSSQTAAVELRSTLNHLAGEHFALAVIGMEKGIKEAKDYDFISWAEDENTKDFKAAMVSIYGEAGGEQFEQVWQKNHIESQGNIVAATLAENDEEVNEAKTSLAQFAEDFGKFLATATEGQLSASDASAALKTHEEQVINAVEQYAAGDYAQSTETFREGYAFMFGIGEVLGEAIVKQMPDQFADKEMPEAMPQTGMGGTSNSHLAMYGLITLGLGFALSGVYFYLRGRTVK